MIQKDSKNSGEFGSLGRFSGHDNLGKFIIRKRSTAIVVIPVKMEPVYNRILPQRGNL